MHDIDLFHHHELHQHDFPGCCKDCPLSLEIINLHAMAFAERIKHYDVTLDEIMGLRVVKALYSMGRVNNTVVAAKLER